MKQGKRKHPAAESTAPEAAAAPEFPDAAYVEQLLGDTESTIVASEVAESAMAAAGGPIELPAQCLLRDAVEYRQRFLSCVDAETVVVDVGAVERIDTAFIQVLLSFVRSRTAQQSITWQRVTSEFSASVRLLGVQAALAIPGTSDVA